LFGRAEVWRTPYPAILEALPLSRKNIDKNKDEKGGEGKKSNKKTNVKNGENAIKNWKTKNANKKSNIKRQ
jgi:hypothetical protein